MSKMRSSSDVGMGGSGSDGTLTCRAKHSPCCVSASDTGGGEGAARCSTVRVSSFPKRRRYRLLSPHAWNSEDPRNA